MDYNVNYGLAHTNLFKAQAIQACQVDTIDSDSHLFKLRSDIDLLLYDKSMQTKIGADSLRNYIDSVNAASSVKSPIDTSKLSDEELFSLINPRDVNTITDAFEYARWCKSHDDELRANYKALQKAKLDAKRFSDSLKVSK